MSISDFLTSMGIAAITLVVTTWIGDWWLKRRRREEQRQQQALQYEAWARDHLPEDEE